MKLFNFKKIQNDKKGFTLLFAILVSVMVLAVGASIINISLKQVILSSAGRESQFAFYAANTGLECALFWDLNGVIVEEDGTPRYVFPPPDSGNLRRTDTDNFDCSRTNIATGDSAYNQSYTKDNCHNTASNECWDKTNPNKTVFRIAVSNNLIETDNILYCAEVTVEKEVVDENGSIVTTITSQGLNTCDPENDPRAVQRGLVLQYRS
ncbi:MAG: hypothetical protein RLY43_724 [Bacteroidota bacterium]|jgi:type II secretory pathway pseudopilin PulG